MRGRAYRRSQYIRAVQHAYRVMCLWHPMDTFERASIYHGHIFVVEDRWGKARQLANNLKPCSCYGCCNRRRDKWMSKIKRLSIQERKALFDEIKEVVI